ncbi:MAG TPA: amidase, partial [Gemmatimonadaceae bacterium]|nr:amidase [Gemmatimonadaceae bacterium]
MSTTDNSDDTIDNGQSTDRTFDRRGFVRNALGAAALAAVPTSLTAQGGTAPPATGRGADTTPPRPLGNGEPPAMVFQPYPGGTGSYLEKLAKERGRDAFERERFTVEGWRGPVPTSEDEIAYLPAHRLAALLQSKRISSVQLTEIYLNRMKRLDPQLLCAVSILEGQAREAAQQADAEIRAGRYRGPLHGIPYGIKDLFAVRGTKTTWGSKAHQDQVIDVDSEVYFRLREAGAVLIAKLATGLFAQGDNWYRGQTKNPWNLTQGSSGSSAGPGSATAAGCVAFGIGTETQGSIVSPTIRNGLSALRPTFGRVSRYGGMVLAWSM